MEQKVLSIKSIYEGPVALRPVNEESEDFVSLADSIAERGLINPISVRPMTQYDADELKKNKKIELESVEGLYILVDGLHRFTASKRAGLSELPVYVRDVTDDEALIDQFMANKHKVETSPAQWTQQLVRIMSTDATLTIKDMAKKLCVNEGFIKQRMKLLKLTQDIQTLVDEGVIPLANAFALSNVPVERQDEFKEKAAKETAHEFAAEIKKVVQEINKAKREGREANEQFVPPTTPTWRNKGEIEAVRTDTGMIGEIVSKNGVTDPVGAFALALTWCMKLDSDSIEEARMKFETRKKNAEEAAKEREEKRRAAKIKKQREKLEELENPNPETKAEGKAVEAAE